MANNATNNLYDDDDVVVSHRKQRKHRQFRQLDITSLVDILTILLVFLIKNVSAEAQRVTVPQEMTLPYSITVEEIGEKDDTVVMRVYPDQIYVGDFKAGSPDEFLTDQKVRTNLYDLMRSQAISIVERDSEMKPILLLQSDRNVQCVYITEIVAMIGNADYHGVYFSTLRGDAVEQVFGWE